VNGLARFILPDALEGGTKRTVESFSAVARIRSLLRCLFTSYAYTGCSGGISPLIIALSPPCPSNYSHRSLRFGGLRRSAHIIRFSRGSSLEHYRPGRENDFGELEFRVPPSIPFSPFLPLSPPLSSTFALPFVGVLTPAPHTTHFVLKYAWNILGRTTAARAPWRGISRPRTASVETWRETGSWSLPASSENVG